MIHGNDLKEGDVVYEYMFDNNDLYNDNFSVEQWAEGVSVGVVAMVREYGESLSKDRLVVAWAPLKVNHTKGKRCKAAWADNVRFYLVYDDATFAQSRREAAMKAIRHIVELGEQAQDCLK